MFNAFYVLLLRAKLPELKIVMMMMMTSLATKPSYNTVLGGVNQCRDLYVRPSVRPFVCSMPLVRKVAFSGDGYAIEH